MASSDFMLYPNNDVGNVKLIFKLIRLYRANECLWNATSLGYNNVKLQENAWKRIAHLLNNEFSIDELKQQMRSLCSYYKSAQRRKLEGKYVEPRYPYYHELKFLNTKSKASIRLVSGSTVFKIPIFGKHTKKPLTRSIHCLQPNTRKTLLTEMLPASTDAAFKDLKLSKIHEDAQAASKYNKSIFYKLSVERINVTDSQIKATKKRRSVSGSDRHPNKYCTKCGKNLGTADECTICKNRYSHQANSKARCSTSSRPNANLVQHSHLGQRPKLVSHSANGESRTKQRQMHAQPHNNPNPSQLGAHQVPAVQQGATVQPSSKLVDTWPVRKLCGEVTGKKLLLGNYNGLPIRDPTQAVKPYVPTNRFFARKAKSNVKNAAPSKECCDSKWQKIKNACSRVNASNASKNYNQDITMSCETLDKFPCCDSTKRIESGGALKQRCYVDCQAGKAAEKAEFHQADADRILIACTSNKTPIAYDKQTASPTRSCIDCQTGKTFKPMLKSESNVGVLVACTSHKTNVTQHNTACSTRSFVDCKTGKIYKAVDKSESYRGEPNEILIACTSQRTIVPHDNKKNISPARSYVDYKTEKASKPAHKSVSQELVSDPTTSNHNKQNVSPVRSYIDYKKVEISKPNLMLVASNSPKATMPQDNFHCDCYHNKQNVSPVRSYIDYKKVETSKPNLMLVASNSPKATMPLDNFHCDCYHNKQNVSPVRSYIDYKKVETSKPNLMLVASNSPKATMPQDNFHCNCCHGHYANWNLAEICTDCIKNAGAINEYEQSEAQARNDLFCDECGSYYERLEPNDLCDDCSLETAKIMESVSNQENNLIAKQSYHNTQLQPLSKQTTQSELTPAERLGLRKSSRTSNADAGSAETTCRVSELRIIEIRHAPTKCTIKNKDTDYDDNNATRKSTNSKSNYSNAACETYLDLNLRQRDRPEVAASEYGDYSCDNQASCSKDIYDNTDDTRKSSTRSHKNRESSGSGQGSYVPTSEQAARTERIIARAKVFEMNQKQRAQQRSHGEHRPKYDASHEASEDTLTCVTEYCNQVRQNRNRRSRAAETRDHNPQERKERRSRHNSKSADRSRHISRQLSGSEAFTWTNKLNYLAGSKERFSNGKHLEKQYLDYRQQAVRDKKEKMLHSISPRTTKPTPNKPISRYPSKNIISRQREQRKYLHNEKMSMARNFLGHINFNATKSKVRLLYPPAQDFCGSKQSYVENETEQAKLRAPVRAQVSRYPKHASERSESRRRKENKRRHD